MKILIIFIFLINLYGATQTCNTVQLLSKYNTDTNKKKLNNQIFPDSCKMMEIGNYLTVRCQCLDDREQALQILPIFKERYPKARVTKTAKYRFKDSEVKKVETKDKSPRQRKSEAQEVPNNKDCYTIQLLTKYDNTQNKKKLYKNSYPKSCHVIKIGNYLTVRCGCYNRRDEAKTLLRTLKKQYRNSMIVKTARSKFNQDIEEKDEIVVIKPLMPESHKKERKIFKPKHKKLILRKPTHIVENIEMLEAPKIIRREVKPINLKSKKNHLEKKFH